MWPKPIPFSEDINGCLQTVLLALAGFVRKWYDIFLGWVQWVQSSYLYCRRPERSWVGWERRQWRPVESLTLSKASAALNLQQQLFSFPASNCRRKQHRKQRLVGLIIQENRCIVDQFNLLFPTIIWIECRQWFIGTSTNAPSRKYVVFKRYA